jgi:hypothetical protein
MSFPQWPFGNSLALDPFDPRFLLGTGPSFAGNYAGSTDHAFALSRALVIGPAMLATGFPAPARGPGVAMRYTPLLWGPGQRGLMVNAPVPLPPL